MPIKKPLLVLFTLTRVDYYLTFSYNLTTIKNLIFRVVDCLKGYPIGSVNTGLIFINVLAFIKIDFFFYVIL